jgi:hypothetical protein
VAWGVRVQFDAGFVDLAPQFAPLVRGQSATAAAALLLLLGLLLGLLLSLPPLLVICTRIALARVGPLLLLWRRAALGARRRHVTVRLRRLLPGISLVLVAVTVTILTCKRRQAGTRHSTAKHQRTNEGLLAAKTGDCWCMDDGCGRDIHGVPLPRCRINR